MAQLVKDKNEATNPAASESLPSQIGLQNKNGTDHLSADAVSLEVPVKIHGSRITESARGATPATEPFEEQTSTMIVFPQGGVLRMATPVTGGQMLVLTNLKSKQDAICRVVKVRTYSSAASYVEVEFTHPQPGYWGVYFSSESPELAKKTSGASALDAPGLEAEPKSADGLVTTPTNGLKPAAAKDPSANIKAQQSKEPGTTQSADAFTRKQSPFIPIGSHEETQPAAASTAFNASSKISATPVSTKPEKTDSPEAVKAVSEKSEPQLHGSEAADNRAASSFGIENRSPSRSLGETFGGDDTAAVGETETAASTPGASQSWKFIAAGVTLGLVLAVGGFVLLRPSSNGGGSAKQASAPVAAVQQVATATAQQQTAPPATTRSSAASVPQSPTPKNNLVAESKRTPEPVAVSAAKTAPKPAETAPEPPQPAAAEKRSTPDVTSDLFGALNAHPVVERSDNARQAAVAPSVDGSAPAPPSVNSALPALPAPSAAPVTVPAPANSAGVLQVGNGVPEPRLLTSTLPDYPITAKQTRTEGSVVVRATVDQTGRVTVAEAVSGPTLLRQSAVSAVKQWKYEPSRVNGKPVAVQIFLTIHFRL